MRAAVVTTAGELLPVGTCNGHAQKGNCAPFQFALPRPPADGFVLCCNRALHIRPRPLHSRPPWCAFRSSTASRPPPNPPIQPVKRTPQRHSEAHGPRAPNGIRSPCWSRAGCLRWAASRCRSSRRPYLSPSCSVGPRPLRCLTVGTRAGGSFDLLRSNRGRRRARRRARQKGLEDTSKQRALRATILRSSTSAENIRASSPPSAGAGQCRSSSQAPPRRAAPCAARRCGRRIARRTKRA